MTSTILIVLAIILAVIGIIGSIVPGLPGPPLSWVGLLLAFLSHKMGGADMTLTTVLVWLAVTVIVSILDYTVPAKFTKLAGGSKAGSQGALIGMLIGIFLTPIGMIPCSLAGAFLAEMFQENKSAGEAFKAALGTFAGFLVGTGMKLIVSVAMAYIILF
ncbi:MAG: DUF456 domain-containing protein [Bacteroidaceae bacterium]|nr:DUF456 domain-containing protein [Bacteroidaceae bacterium]